MARPIYLPDEVREDIAAHFRRVIPEAVADFWAASANEDALTGYLGRALRQPARTVAVTRQEVPRQWSWSMTYASFRSDGPAPAENLIGTDGVFELSVDDTFTTTTKSLLFQAKKNRRFDAKLLHQAVLMLTWREAAFVLDYSPDEYRAYTLSEVITDVRRIRSSPDAGQPLAEFLSERFLKCKVGDTDLRYDPQNRTLTWKAKDDGRVATALELGHQFKIVVEASEPVTVIDRERIHDYRMDATESDILGVEWNAPLEELKRAKKREAKVLALDGLNIISDFERQILNRHHQTLNHAFDVMRDRVTPKPRRQEHRSRRRSNNAEPPNDPSNKTPA